MDERNRPFKPCIIVHGGAGSVPLQRRKPAVCAVKEAVKTGYQVLLQVRKVLLQVRCLSLFTAEIRIFYKSTVL